MRLLPVLLLLAACGSSPPSGATCPGDADRVYPQDGTPTRWRIEIDTASWASTIEYLDGSATLAVRWEMTGEWPAEDVAAAWCAGELHVGLCTGKPPHGTCDQPSDPDWQRPPPEFRLWADGLVLAFAHWTP